VCDARVQSLTGFTTVLFAVELILLIAAFRLRFFRHLGYVVDMLVVSACFYHDLAGLGKGKMIEVIMVNIIIILWRDCNASLTSRLFECVRATQP